MLLTDPFYYLKHFQAMLDALLARDGDLLDAEENAFIRGFASLPQRAQALLVRMVMRKGSLFRASRLQYAEIAGTAAAVQPLIDEQWVDDRPALCLDDWFKLVTKSEVAHHLALSREQASYPKAALRETLRPMFTEARPFQEWCSGHDWCRACSDTVYRLVIDPVCERLRLMFFGNFRQDWSEFVLKDMGVFKFESIDLRHESRPFACRRQVDVFHRLYQCRRRLHEGAPPAEIEVALPPPVRDCEWLEDRRQKLRFQIGRAYERVDEIGQALALYADCSYPDAALRIRRIERRLGHGARRAARCPVPTFNLTLQPPVAPRSVESLVMDHLLAATDEPTCVYFVENALINSLFGLLCWRAIFAPLPGAFFHAYHHGPADLTSRGFAERRAADFDACFALLQSSGYQETIRRHFIEKAGITSPFVAWGFLDSELLDLALQCFPASHLAAWFEWIVRDVSANRSGFPDLVQFWPHSRRYRLIEVKGPGDRLQENQRRCLEFCLSRSIPVSVCRVSFLESISEVYAQTPSDIC